VVRWYFTYNMAWGPTGQFRQAVIDTVNHFAPTRQSLSSPSRPIRSRHFRRPPIRSPIGRQDDVQSLFQPTPVSTRVTDPVSPGKGRPRLRVPTAHGRGGFERRPPSIVFAERNRAASA
jgi:hypothetical protein